MRIATTAVSVLLLGGTLTGCMTYQAAPKADPTPSATATPSEAAEPIAEKTPVESETAAAFTVSRRTTCEELIMLGDTPLMQRSIDWVLKDSYSLPRDSKRNYEIVQSLRAVSERAVPQFQPYLTAVTDLMDEMRNDIDRGIEKSYDLDGYRAAALELTKMCGA